MLLLSAEKFNAAQSAPSHFIPLVAICETNGQREHRSA
jgi:hypothetical protein